MTDRKKSSAEDPLFVSSLEKGMQILNIFKDNRRYMSSTQITDLTGLEKSAVQRFLHTWTKMGYLIKDPINRHYGLAPRNLDLGFAFSHNSPFLNVATIPLTQLHAKLQQTINLSLLDGGEIVYALRMPSPEYVTNSMYTGRRLPVYCTSPGRIILAQFSVEEQKEILQQTTLESHTKYTITDQDQILEKIQEAKEEGYAIINQEFIAGEIAIAVPVFNYNRKVAGAVNVIFDTTNWDENKIINDVLPILRRSVQEIIVPE